ncbi:hypothetical protein QBC34DRAFT_393545 [Podospora aff. communis PSN243]|uniref:Uncharacterized protein n=1 Tax=Podospora aff. communis PSN243 TaxID=3040156 RepID=A0AAV9H1A7_9PEZI|nr:hypothetical protein QBC34DRAFT_393545 [Podospora aff. communis PSN243]
MASQPTPSLLRPSTLCFDLENVFLSGTLNRFKNPQLVLKSHYGPAPRTPFTGLQTQTSDVRHLLMVHVSDRANELEVLDLDEFALPPDGQDETVHRQVEYLVAESSLAFHYPKGASKSRHTLKVKFRGPVDIATVLTELWALKITVQNASPGIQGHLTASQDPRGLASQPTHHHAPSRYQTPRHVYSRSSPLAIQPNTTDWRSPYFANPAYQLAPSRPPSQLTNHSMSPPTVWPSISPVSQIQRPATTTTGIPGVLGEGVYKISRVSSAPGGRPTRPRMRESMSAFGFYDPRPYTVSKYFDKTLERSDIARLLGRRSFHGEETPEGYDPENSAITDKDSQETANNRLGSLQFSQRSDATTRHSGKIQKVTAAAQGRRKRPAEDGLLRIANLNHEGLLEATKIWEDLIERGRKESKLVSNMDEAQKIWSKYGEDWEKKVNHLAANVAKKMRSEEERIYMA